MLTRNGIIKKVEANAFENVRRSGLIAVTLKQSDTLGWARHTAGTDDIILATKNGQSIRFSERDVRAMGRQAAGVTGIRLKKSDEVVGMDIIRGKEGETANLLVIMEMGLGKQTPVKQYKRQRRGGSGIKTAKVTQKTGRVVNARIINQEQSELIAISRKGQVIRTQISSVPTLGRRTQGVRIMRMDQKDAIASITTL